MTKTRVWILPLLLTAVTTGCERRDQTAAPGSSERGSQQQSTPAAPVSSNITDQWLGKWIGPEGTYLVLSKSGQKYTVEIHSLDGPATFEGASRGDHIDFERNGKKESIHAGDGEDTGMKWLLDKKNCLIIKTGEGFCRD